MEQGTDPGRVLGGRYRIEGTPRHGGFRQMLPALDEHLGVRVALEELGPADPATSARAQRVAHKLADLRSHPNLVPVYDLVQSRGVLWRVVPFIPGPSLAERLADQGPMRPEEVRKAAEALLDALTALHGVGIVHGDMQPANVLSAGGRWVLLPGAEGRQREIDETLDAADWGRLTGPADYIAPELLSGARPRPSTDVFALGATLYQMLTGRGPFHRDDPLATLQAAKQEDPPPLFDSGELGPLVGRLLDKRPERRPTAAEARAMLNAFDKESQMMATPASVAPRGVRSHSPVAAGVLLATLVVAAALAGAAVRADVSTDDVRGLFAVLLPWAVFAAGLCVLTVQALASLTRYRAGQRMPWWRWYARSVAPPTRWTGKERARRRSAAEQAVDTALLAVDRRLASTSPGTHRGVADV